jgi:hypothetical protein
MPAPLPHGPPGDFDPFSTPMGGAKPRATCTVHDPLRSDPPLPRGTATHVRCDGVLGTAMPEGTQDLPVGARRCGRSAGGGRRGGRGVASCAYANRITKCRAGFFVLATAAPPFGRPRPVGARTASVRAKVAARVNAGPSARADALAAAAHAPSTRRQTRMPTCTAACGPTSSPPGQLAPHTCGAKTGHATHKHVLVLFDVAEPVLPT